MSLWGCRVEPAEGTGSTALSGGQRGHVLAQGKAPRCLYSSL